MECMTEIFRGIFRGIGLRQRRQFDKEKHSMCHIPPLKQCLLAMHRASPNRQNPPVSRHRPVGETDQKMSCLESSISELVIFWLPLLLWEFPLASCRSFPPPVYDCLHSKLEVGKDRQCGYCRTKYKGEELLQLQISPVSIFQLPGDWNGMGPRLASWGLEWLRIRLEWSGDATGRAGEWRQNGSRIKVGIAWQSLEIRLSMCACHGKFKNAKCPPPHTHLLCSRRLYCWESEVPESAEQEWLRVGNTAPSPALRWWPISAVTCQYDEYSCAHSTPPANLPQNLHKKVCRIQSIVMS